MSCRRVAPGQAALAVRADFLAADQADEVGIGARPVDQGQGPDSFLAGIAGKPEFDGDVVVQDTKGLPADGGQVQAPVRIVGGAFTNPVLSSTAANGARSRP
jgi:hypothetical protein